MYSTNDYFYSDTLAELYRVKEEIAQEFPTLELLLEGMRRQHVELVRQGLVKPDMQETQV